MEDEIAENIIIIITDNKITQLPIVQILILFLFFHFIQSACSVTKKK
jgi:hypothetical protein